MKRRRHHCARGHREHSGKTWAGTCWGGPLRLVALENTTRMLPGSLAETVCRNTALARVKMVVLAPMPSVSESTATSVKPGFFTSMRTAYFRSCRNVSIKSPRQDTDISLGRRKVKKDRDRGIGARK